MNRAPQVQDRRRAPGAPELPTLEPDRLLELGGRLAPLRDEGVLLIGSGFTTHGLPFLRDWRTDATPPGWSAEFDAWAPRR